MSYALNQIYPLVLVTVIHLMPSPVSWCLDLSNVLYRLVWVMIKSLSEITTPRTYSRPRI